MFPQTKSRRTCSNVSSSFVSFVEPFQTTNSTKQHIPTRPSVLACSWCSCQCWSTGWRCWIPYVFQTWCGCACYCCCVLLHFHNILVSSKHNTVPQLKITQLTYRHCNPHTHTRHLLFGTHTHPHTTHCRYVQCGRSNRKVNVLLCCLLSPWQAADLVRHRLSFVRVHMLCICGCAKSAFRHCVHSSVRNNYWHLLVWQGMLLVHTK